MQSIEVSFEIVIPNLFRDLNTKFRFLSEILNVMGEPYLFANGSLYGASL